jgi:proteasome lid subunit RPN8/RPN11
MRPVPFQECPHVLELSRDVHLQILAHALDEAPLECCGLLVGQPGEARAERYVPCRNAAASSRVYTVEPRDLLRADREAQDAGLELVGVVHSHTHTPAYPSATDIDAAVDPGWHYAIVSLALGEPVVRSYRIGDGNVSEEDVVVVPVPGGGNRSGHAPVAAD